MDTNWSDKNGLSVFPKVGSDHIKLPKLASSSELFEWTDQVLRVEIISESEMKAAHAALKSGLGLKVLRATNFLRVSPEPLICANLRS